MHIMSKPTEFEDDWFFIVGCQRSGTTLMRLVLECHSDIQCYDEMASYRILKGVRKVIRTKRFVGLKTPCITEQFSEPTISDVRLLKATRNDYAGQKLIFLIRDVRDVVTSMLKLRIGGKSWLEKCGIPTLEWTAANPYFMQHYGGRLQDAKRARFPKLASGALYWRYKSEALLQYQRRGYPVLMVQYENLVSQPRVELSRVCEFLDVGWRSELLNHPAHTHGEIGRNGLAMGDTDPKRGIDERSIGQWSDRFSPEEVDEILRFAGPLQRMLYRTSSASVPNGYPTPNRPKYNSITI